MLATQPPLRGSAIPELHGAPPTWRPPLDSACMLARTPMRAMGRWSSSSRCDRACGVSRRRR
eukprot:9768574-Alexandrium_andersonii.AAC.1